MNFYHNQLQKEIEYIENKYLSCIIPINNNIKIKGDFIIRKVILNNTTYKMYIKNNEDFQILLIPDKSFNDDFNDIIEYQKNEEELSFSLISKKDNYVKLFNYVFYTNDGGYSNGNYFYNEFIDDNNLINLNKILIPNILSNLRLYNNNYHLYRIKRNKKETKLNEINENSLLKAYELYDSHFNKIDDNESPIIEIFENMYKKINAKARI